MEEIRAHSNNNCDSRNLEMRVEALKMDYTSATYPLIPATIIASMSAGLVQQGVSGVSDDMSLLISSGLVTQSLVRTATYIPLHALWNNKRFIVYDKNTNKKRIRFGRIGQDMASVFTSANIVSLAGVGSFLGTNSYFLHNNYSAFESGFYASLVIGSIYTIGIGLLSPNIDKGIEYLKNTAKNYFSQPKREKNKKTI